MSYFNPPSGWNPLLARIPLAPPAPPKRNVFISSFHNDRHEVNAFIYHWGTLQKVFTPKALCTFDNDDFINSTNPQYVMGQIREKYLLDSTVTIVLIGKCTHSRRYIDWEIKSSLRRGEYTPNGLIGFLLPSAMPTAHLPERFSANWNQQQNCYARYHTMPESVATMRRLIEDAFLARTNRAHLIQNDSEMMKNNAVCKVCRFTH